MLYLGEAFLSLPLRLLLQGAVDDEEELSASQVASDLNPPSGTEKKKQRDISRVNRFHPYEARVVEVIHAVRKDDFLYEMLDLIAEVLRNNKKSNHTIPCT